jgi:hypothetical protein
MVLVGNNITVSGSGTTIDGARAYLLTKLISKTSLSGGSVYHTHALLDLAEGTPSLYPKYDGQAFEPTPYGDFLDRVIYNKHQKLVLFLLFVIIFNIK